MKRQDTEIKPKQYNYYFFSIKKLFSALCCNRSSILCHNLTTTMILILCQNMKHGKDRDENRLTKLTATCFTVVYPSRYCSLFRTLPHLT